MEFNKSKCYVLPMSHKKQSIGTCYYFQDTPLEMSTKQKYLGVDLCNDLDWSHRISSITSTANKTFGLLCHNLKSCSPYIENISYKTLVRLLLEYCSPIWDPYE